MSKHADEPRPITMTAALRLMAEILIGIPFTTGRRSAK